jgi:hypothetical protein
MARTAVALQDMSVQPSSAAVTLTTVDAVNNNMVPNNGNTLIVIQNPTGGSLSATVVSTSDQFGRTGDLVISLAAGEIRAVGPLPAAVWNQRSTDIGFVYVNPAAALKIGALNLNT